MKRIEILDSGYLELVDTWGSDQMIIEGARMSTQKGFLGWGDVRREQCAECGGSGEVPKTVHGVLISDDDDLVMHDCSRCGGSGNEPGDEKLLKRLWDYQHSTPFEMAGLTVEVQAPITVFREWHRHRIPFGYSEASARYAPLPELNYVPELARLFMVSETNKQAGTAKGADVLTETAARAWLDSLEDAYQHIERVYQEGLRIGIPKEVARLPMAVGRYSKMRATGNVRGWLAFCKLRCAEGAQWEIRQYANAVAGVIKEQFPYTYEVARESVGLS